MNAEGKVKAVLNEIKGGVYDGDHHKMYLIDQIVRILTDCPIERTTASLSSFSSYQYEARGKSEEYKKFVADYCDGEDGPDTYQWNTGIAP